MCARGVLAEKSHTLDGFYLSKSDYMCEYNSSSACIKYRNKTGNVMTILFSLLQISTRPDVNTGYDLAKYKN